jgi:hypothetical protein
MIMIMICATYMIWLFDWPDVDLLEGGWSSSNRDVLVSIFLDTIHPKVPPISAR